MCGWRGNVQSRGPENILPTEWDSIECWLGPTEPHIIHVCSVSHDLHLILMVNMSTKF